MHAQRDMVVWVMVAAMATTVWTNGSNGSELLSNTSTSAIQNATQTSMSISSALLTTGAALQAWSIATLVVCVLGTVAIAIYMCSVWCPRCRGYHPVGPSLASASRPSVRVASVSHGIDPQTPNFRFAFEMKNDAPTATTGTFATTSTWNAAGRHDRMHAQPMAMLELR